MRLLALTAFFGLSTLILMAQTIKADVKIVDRRVEDATYSYVVPGRASGTSTSHANCFDLGSSINCSGSTTSTGSVVPPRQISYDVRGATFTLELPDRRLVVVNCESKYALRGDHVNRRSCRIPIVNEIRAEFDRDNAKLFWPVSLDGKKMQSETYKILGILNAE